MQKSPVRSQSRPRTGQQSFTARQRLYKAHKGTGTLPLPNGRTTTQPQPCPHPALLLDWGGLVVVEVYPFDGVGHVGDEDECFCFGSGYCVCFPV